MTAQEFKELKKRVMVFKDLDAAKDVVNNHAVKLLLIVQGDCPEYWVAVPSVTEKLVKAGYEYAV